MSICRVLIKFEKTVLGVLKLQKTIPQNVELGLTICHTNEFVQSCFSDGFLNCPVYK